MWHCDWVEKLITKITTSLKREKLNPLEGFLHDVHRVLNMSANLLWAPHHPLTSDWTKQMVEMVLFCIISLSIC